MRWDRLPTCIRTTQSAADIGGNGNRLQPSTRPHQAPHGHDPSVRHGPPLVLEHEPIGDTRPPQLRHMNGDADLIAKSQSRAVIARNGDAGPAVFAAIRLPLEHMQAKVSQQLVFGRLHPEEKRREVHDPRGVGIAKLYSADCRERSVVAT